MQNVILNTSTEWKMSKVANLHECLNSIQGMKSCANIQLYHPTPTHTAFNTLVIFFFFIGVLLQATGDEML